MTGTGDTERLGRLHVRDLKNPKARNRSPTDCRSTRAAPTSTRKCCVQGVGIRFNGQEKTNVEEYCISEGWIRMAVGRSRDRHGNPMTIKMSGKVEPYYDAAKESEQGEK